MVLLIACQSHRITAGVGQLTGRRGDSLAIFNVTSFGIMTKSLRQNISSLISELGIFVLLKLAFRCLCQHELHDRRFDILVKPPFFQLHFEFSFPNYEVLLILQVPHGLLHCFVLIKIKSLNERFLVFPLFWRMAILDGSLPCRKRGAFPNGHDSARVHGVDKRGSSWSIEGTWDSCLSRATEI